MSICRARLRNTSKALTFRMSGEQIRLQVPRKLFGVNSWIAQMIRQWIPDCWSGDRKCADPASAAAISRNWRNWYQSKARMWLHVNKQYQLTNNTSTNRELPDRLTHLTDCNFIIRMLFYQVYWHYFTLHIYIFVLVIVFTAFWQWINKRVLRNELSCGRH